MSTIFFKLFYIYLFRLFIHCLVYIDYTQALTCLVVVCVCYQDVSLISLFSLFSLISFIGSYTALHTRCKGLTSLTSAK